VIFVAIGIITVIFYIQVSLNFPYFLTWVKFGTEALHIMSFLYHCCFCENQYCEGHTLFEVLNQMFLIFFTFFIQLG